MLGEAAMRFIRTRWKSAIDLSEELYAVLSKPLDITPSSITINQPAGATLPPITITQPPGTTTPPIQITRGDEVITVGGTGGGGGGGGGPDLGNIDFPGQNPGDGPEATPPPALNPIPLHGRVVGKVSGNTYTVRCWAKNPNVYPPIGVLNVTFPDVDADDTIPTGARCPVIMFPKIVFNVTTVDFAIGYVSVFLQPLEAP